MPAVKRRYFILFLVLILLLVGWSARLYLAEFLITSPMKQAGLEDVTADIKQLSLNQTQLSQLGFVLLSKSGQLTLDAHDISISYLPGKLIKGDIDRLEINQLDLHYKLNPEPLTDHNEAQPVIAAAQLAEILGVLRMVLDEYLHFNELAIHHISLNGEVFAELDGKALSLISNKNEDAIYAELTFHGETTDNQSADAPQLVITRLTKDKVEAELRPAQAARNLPAKLKLDLKETEISGSYLLSVPAMQAWLQAVTGIKDIAGLDIFSSSQSGGQSSNQNNKLSGTLSLNFENSDLLHATISSAVKRLSFDTYHAENIVFDIKLAYSTLAAKHQLKLLDGSYLGADKLSTRDSTFTDNRIKLAGELLITDSRWKYRGTLSSKLLSASYQSQQLKLANIVATITADAQQLQATGKFSPATLPGQFGFALTHNLSSNAGTVAIKPIAAIELNSENHKLSKLLTPWPYPLDLYTGTIKLSAEASWFKDKKPRLSTDISLKDSGGNVGTIVFSGLSFDHKLEVLPVLQSVQASEIRLSTIDSGIAISNTSMQLAAKPSKRGQRPRIIVRQTRGEILGGNFTADDMVYDLNRNKNNFIIKLNNIDLAEVVKTQQLEDITATGRLDGSLPVEINKDGIYIAHGGLSNQIRGGIIRYTPESGTEQLRQNPITGITLDALKDFRYSDLQADVNYLPDGELTINLQLKGISPELDEKRPVLLNINTEQNLVSLLKSLRFAQGVSDSIDDQVRRIYEQTHKNNE